VARSGKAHPSLSPAPPRMQLTVSPPPPPPQRFPSGQARYCFEPLLYDLSRRQTISCRMSRRLYFHFTLPSALARCRFPAHDAEGLSKCIRNAVNAANGSRTAGSLALSNTRTPRPMDFFTRRCALYSLSFGAREHISGSRGRGMSEAGLNPIRDNSLHTNIHVSAQPMQYS
jgi:hypothetical protein